MLSEKINFEADEKILIQVRKHWFVLAMEFFGVVLAGLFPLFVYILFNTIDVFKGITDFASMNGPYLIGFYSAWLLVVWMVGFGVWTNYYLDVWTITNKRLVAIDQRGLFHRHTSSFRLERLQDMSVEFHGMLQTFLDFGTLEAETAGGGEEDKFRITGLPHPRELKAIILAASDTLMRDDTVKKAVTADGL